MKKFFFLKNKQELKKDQNKKNKLIFHKSQKLQNSNRIYSTYKKNLINIKNGKELCNKTPTKTS